MDLVGPDLPAPLVAEVVAWAGDALTSLVDRLSLFLAAVEFVLLRAPSAQRDIDFLEVFAGSHRATTLCLRLGLRAYAFDRVLQSRQDICLLVGLVLCGLHVLRVVPRGLVWFSPRCAAWLPWVSQHNHRRCHANPLGDTTRMDVMEANLSATAVAWLTMLADLRQVHIVIEQPLRSHFFLILL